MDLAGSERIVSDYNVYKKGSNGKELVSSQSKTKLAKFIRNHTLQNYFKKEEVEEEEELSKKAKQRTEANEINLSLT